jgi:hypothetical protein
MSNTSLIVGNQIPEYIRNDSPKFVEFLKAYYKFMEGYSLKLETLRDVDRVSESLLSLLKSEYLKNFPSAVINDRQLIKLVRRIYDAKGTITAVELLFRLFFNERVVVFQPSRNILRASDGRWQEEYAITVSSVYGAIDFDKPIVLRFENSFGSFTIDVERYEIIDDNLTRFFYRSFNEIFVEPPQLIDILGPNNSITFRGEVVRSPRRLTVSNPGKFWKRGQIFQVPGTEVPTLAQVTAIGPDGELLNADIVRFGFTHTPGQITVVSPFLNKPPPGSFEYEFEQTGVDIDDNPIFTHYLTLNDFNDSITEQLTGVTNKKSDLSYALSDYELEFYSGATAFSFTIAALPAPQQAESLITYEQWLQSRATLVYEFDYIVKYKGRFATSDGHLSDPEYRLQDNYFYQLFSYVIETENVIKDYRTALTEIHPAGLKYFADLVKKSTLELSVQTHTVIEQV